LKIQRYIFSCDIIAIPDTFCVVVKGIIEKNDFPDRFAILIFYVHNHGMANQEIAINQVSIGWFEM
ncbi:MAG: hypothetical protein LBE91_03555, partial [Tannerella sp.]|nr:hypothetical protein [Tannerella sp.]